jgi:hypothetical protein
LRRGGGGDDPPPCPCVVFSKKIFWSKKILEIFEKRKNRQKIIQLGKVYKLFTKNFKIMSKICKLKKNSKY